MGSYYNIMFQEAADADEVYGWLEREGFIVVHRYEYLHGCSVMGPGGMLRELRKAPGVRAVAPSVQYQIMPPESDLQ